MIVYEKLAACLGRSNIFTLRVEIIQQEPQSPHTSDQPYVKAGLAIYQINMSIKSASEGAISTANEENFKPGSSSPSSRSKPNGSESSSALISAHKKVDRRLILWYSAVYLVMRIHVSNISNTAIINLEQGDGIKKRECSFLSSMEQV